jgi:hypothetical protein
LERPGMKQHDGTAEKRKEEEEERKKELDYV